MREIVISQHTETDLCSTNCKMCNSNRQIKTLNFKCQNSEKHRNSVVPTPDISIRSGNVGVHTTKISQRTAIQIDDLIHRKKSATISFSETFRVRLLALILNKAGNTNAPLKPMR